ncbi:MAG: carboxypeptidase-like regulatory domain-containing protein [Minisyncoccia bacterium]
MKSPISLQGKGFTLIEIVLGIFIIAFISFFIFNIFQNISRVTTSGRLTLQLLSLLQDEMEKVRVLNYEDIGIQGGWPPGVLPREKIVNKKGLEVKINFYVRNIDDPKDGTITTTPRDTAPADYKLVEIEGEILNSPFKIKKQTLSALIAPKTVEATTRNGSMFIQVIDAKGSPVKEARVKVDYLNEPQFTIQDVTDVWGMLRLIDIPPGINAYAISVTKEGYSSEKTYKKGQEYPNPLLPHQTVRSGELTTVTFQIDLLSKLKVRTQDIFCRSVPNVSLNLQGLKLINTDPPMPKTDITTTTNESGEKELTIEFDSYFLKINDPRYVLGSSLPYLENPFNVQPNMTYSYALTLKSYNPKNLLVSVFDEERNLIEGARVNLFKGNKLIATQKTGEEIYRDDDWSLGKYSSLSSGIDPETFPGEIRLKDLGGFYSTSTEWLISKEIDFGTSSIIYKKFSWSGNLPPGTSIKFQLASNNDNSTWNFVGPDGTPNTYFETQEFEIPSFLQNKRFLKYKVYMQTSDPLISPSLDKIKISFTSSCFSLGETLFQNLNPGKYLLEVIKEGYFFYSKDVNISDEDFYHEKIILTR